MATHSTTFLEMKKSLTDFQKSICEPVGPLRTSNHPGNNLYSEYHPENRKCTWTYHASEVLFSEMDQSASSESKESIINYIANPVAYGILYTDFCHKIPSIVCKEGYKARWSKDIMYNIFQSAELLLGDLSLQTIDSFYIDGYNQAMIDPYLCEVTDINIGNAEYLQNWNDRLPFHNCSLLLPWFYSEDQSRYFPLHYCGYLTKLTHKIKYKNYIFDFLEIIDSEDRHVKFPEGISQIDGTILPKKIDGLVRMEVPKLWGEYLYKSDTEIEYDRCTTDNLRLQGIDNAILYTDIITYISKEEHKIGDLVKIPILTTFPITGIIWGAQNTSSLCNYSASKDEDWSPIKYASLETPSGIIFKNMPSYRTNRVYPQKHLKCIPKKQGFNYWFSAGKYRPINQHPGMIMKDGFLSIQLHDMNPWIGENPTSDLFRIHVSFMVTKRITFESFLQGNKDSIPVKAVIYG